MKIIWLDIKQNKAKIIYRIVSLLIPVFIILILNWTGIFSKMSGLISKIPSYLKPLMGVFKETNLLEYGNWILFISIFMELFFVYISIMDVWKLKTDSIEKGRFLLWGNQLYTRLEIIIIEYISVCIRFFIIWIPYKIVLGVFCREEINLFINILTGLGIYLAIIAFGVLIATVFEDRKIYYDIFYMFLIFLLFIGNIYKFFNVLKFKIASNGNVPSEMILQLESKIQKLHDYSIISYLNPIYADDFFKGFTIFITGVILAGIFLGISIRINKNKDY